MSTTSSATRLHPPHAVRVGPTELPSQPSTTSPSSSSYAANPPIQPLGSFNAAEFSLVVGPIERQRAVGGGGGQLSSVPQYSKYQIHFKSERDEPKIIKNYHMGEILGRGTYGKVREAYDFLKKRYVAVKILNKHRLRKIRGGVDNVNREIYIMKRLQDEHVVQLYEVFDMETTNKLYLVLELVDGGSLQTRLESSPNGRLEPGEARWWFRQLLQGLEYCHSRGVIHRDIKPSNLMITLDGILKISDFGVAELLDPRWGGEAIKTSWDGSPAFVAPEVASGSDFVSGFKVDVWAVGVTLYLLVTGYVPFQGITLFKLFENISKGVFPIPPWIDADLRDLLEHLMDPNEDTRYLIPEIKQHRWVCKQELTPPVPFPTDATVGAPSNNLSTDVNPETITPPEISLSSISDRCVIL